MNKLKLKSVMALHAETFGDLAELLGIARTTLSLKVNENGSEFTQGEIMAIKEHYHLSADQLDEIFFASEVSE